MQAEPRSVTRDAFAPHPLAELLDCPAAAETFLTASAQMLHLEPGQYVFRQGASCRGLYVIISGQFERKAERLNARLTLGRARAGDLLELAAALGDGVHTYTLSALTAGALLLLPMDELRRAFQSYPPLRMRLLEELAREVSRAYLACSIVRPRCPIRRSLHGRAIPNKF